MGEAVSIWSPVVVGKLDRPHHLQAHFSCALDQVIRSIEDLKIKVKTAVVKAQGLAVEASLKLDILCLVEDMKGQMHLISHEEIVRNRVPLEDFDQEMDRDRELKYVLDIQDIDCQGEIKNEELHVDYFIDFMIVATRDQLVQLSAQEEATVSNVLDEVLGQLRGQIDRMEGENRDLRRRIYYYERDISSLKKGIHKSEAQRSRLSQELSSYQRLVEELQIAVRDRERRLQNLENPYYSPVKAVPAEDKTDTGEVPLGSRIKRLFVNSTVN